MGPDELRTSLNAPDYRTTNEIEGEVDRDSANREESWDDFIARMDRDAVAVPAVQQDKYTRFPENTNISNMEGVRARLNAITREIDAIEQEFDRLESEEKERREQLRGKLAELRRAASDFAGGTRKATSYEDLSKAA